MADRKLELKPSTYKPWKGKETFGEVCQFLNGELHHSTTGDVSCKVKQTDISLSKNEQHVDVSLHRPTCADVFGRIENVGVAMLQEGDQQYFKKHVLLQPRGESGEGLYLTPRGDIELLTRKKTLAIDFRP